MVKTEYQVTSNDAQIDLLLKRHAQRATARHARNHLDADELNAFAEGSMPAATRERFVSHLGDCDDCRRLATQLMMASGAGSKLTLAQESTSEGRLWSKKLAALFAPARLRYAAFAIVVIAAATVTFVVLRDRGARQFTERAAKSNATETAKVEEYQQAKAQADTTEKATAKSASAIPQPTVAPNVGLKQRESTVAQKSQPVMSESNSQLAINSRDAMPSRTPEPREAVPSFAPPPPGETARAQQNQNREMQTVGGLAGRKKDENANAKFGALDRIQTSENQTKRSGTLRTESAANNQPAANVRQAADDKSLAKSKETDTVSATSGSANEARIQTAAPKPALRKAPAAAPRADSEEAPSTRTIGGRKFQRQGNVWVDTKFKTSMNIKSISRGSDEYRELDAGLRSIAEQLGSEVIIVRKGKAYHIR